MAVSSASCYSCLSLALVLLPVACRNRVPPIHSFLPPSSKPAKPSSFKLSQDTPIIHSPSSLVSLPREIVPPLVSGVLHGMYAHSVLPHPFSPPPAPPKKRNSDVMCALLTRVEYIEVPAPLAQDEVALHLPRHRRARYRLARVQRCGGECVCWRGWRRRRGG